MSWWNLKVTQNEFIFVWFISIHGPSKRAHASYLNYQGNMNMHSLTVTHPNSKILAADYYQSIVVAMIDISAWRASIGLWNCCRITSRCIHGTAKPDHYTGESRTKIKYVITLTIVALFLLFYKLLKMNPKG